MSQRFCTFENLQTCYVGDVVMMALFVVFAFLAIVVATGYVVKQINKESK